MFVVRRRLRPIRTSGDQIQNRLPSTRADRALFSTSAVDHAEVEEAGALARLALRGHVFPIAFVGIFVAGRRRQCSADICRRGRRRCRAATQRERDEQCRKRWTMAAIGRPLPLLWRIASLQSGRVHGPSAIPSSLHSPARFRRQDRRGPLLQYYS
jgi:hypothetical protein